jgi:Protein of unknown function (DUF4446)
VHALTHTTTGIVALVAGGIAVVGLLTSIGLAFRLMRVRADQRLVLGSNQREDLVAHAARLEGQFEALHSYVEDVASALHDRMRVIEGRLDGAIAYRSLIHYDAYGEMSGRQSTSIALLDETRSGLVLSSIHHRDQARLYAKQIHEGSSEHELSPEENEAIKLALGAAGDRHQAA